MLSRWGVSKKLVSLIASLHSQAWFRYGTHDAYGATRHGGRQGCVLGGIVFNAAFAVALRIVRHELEKLGLAFLLPECTGAFWDPTHDAHGSSEQESALDIAFVDDTTYMFSELSAARLLNMLRVAVPIIEQIFAAFGIISNLRLNLSKSIT